MVTPYMKQSTFRGAPIPLLVIGMSVLVFLTPGYAGDQDDLQLAAPVSPSKTIRFYKVNKQLQASRIMLTAEKAVSTGCQNFLKSVRVHRAMQTGFTACFLYAKKNCNANSIVHIAREEEPRQTSFMTEGVGWMPQSEEPKGVKLASWNCGIEVEPEQLGHEAGLAAGEVARLAMIAGKAAKRAAIAQQKADQAQNAANQAIEQADLARRRAIAVGAIIPVEEISIGEEILTDEPVNVKENNKGNKKNKKKPES